MAAKYRPGLGTAVVQDCGIVLLGADVSQKIAEEIWQSCQPSVDLSVVLGIVTRHGLADLPDFAVVTSQGSGARVVIHGNVVVETAADAPVGRVRHDGRNVSTWTEYAVADVRRVTVEFLSTVEPTDSSVLPTYPVLAGVVLASAVMMDFCADSAPTQVDSRAGLAAELPPLPATEPPIVGPPDGADDVDDDTVLDQTVLKSDLVDIRRRLPTWPEDKVPGPFPVSAGYGTVPEAGPTDVMDGPTATRSGLPQDSGPVVSTGGRGATSGYLPNVGREPVVPVPVTTLPPHNAQSAAPSVAARAHIALSSGLVVPLDRPVLLGRAPMMSRVASGVIPRLVTVDSPRRDISRTHVQVIQYGAKVLVTDLDSTNGVYLLEPGITVRRLHPGEPTVAPVGSTIDIGDGVTFTVEHAL